MYENLIMPIVVALILAALFWVPRKIKNVRDANKIYNWLEQNTQPNKDHFWRSTRTIASATHMTEERVEVLCSHDKKLKRSTGEKKVWGIERYVKNQTIKPRESKYDPAKIDKILEIYDAIKKFIASIQVAGTTDNDNLMELLKKTKHAKVLFKDKEVAEHVDLLYHKGLNLEFIEKQLWKTNNQKRREELAQKSHDLFTWFSDQHETVDKMFEPFLNK